MNTLKIEIPEGFKIDTFDEKTGVVKFSPLPKDITERIKNFGDVLELKGSSMSDFWKSWLIQSWGDPDYTQIWDGEILFDEDFFDEINDAKIYKEVWEIKGTLELNFEQYY